MWMIFTTSRKILSHDELCLVSDQYDDIISTTKNPKRGGYDRDVTISLAISIDELDLLCLLSIPNSKD